MYDKPAYEATLEQVADANTAMQSLHDQFVVNNRAHLVEIQSCLKEMSELGNTTPQTIDALKREHTLAAEILTHINSIVPVDEDWKKSVAQLKVFSKKYSHNVQSKAVQLNHQLDKGVSFLTSFKTEADGLFTAPAALPSVSSDSQPAAPTPVQINFSH